MMMMRACEVAMGRNGGSWSKVQVEVPGWIDGDDTQRDDSVIEVEN